MNLKGKPAEKLGNIAKSENFVLVPDSFCGIVPKVIVKPGEKVLAGSVLMIDKSFPEIKFVSPVSGEVTAVERGEKRKVLGIVVKRDAINEFADFGKKDVAKLSAEDVKQAMLDGGVWPFITQRPYAIVANPTVEPRDIFVSGFDSAPLAPNFDFVAKDDQDAILAGIAALKKLTKGKVFVGVRGGSSIKFNGAEVVTIDGPHPSGNVGVQAHNIKAVNKGETIWTLNGFDLILIGRLFTQGKSNFERTVAITGSEISTPCYVKAYPGTPIKDLVSGNILNSGYKQRYITGNVLSGDAVGIDGYLGYTDSQITVIPDGSDCDEFVGWALPGLAKYSVSHTYLTWLFGGSKEYTIDSRLQGGKRALIVSGDFEKVVPMDIYTEFLYKEIGRAHV